MQKGEKPSIICSIGKMENKLEVVLSKYISYCNGVALAVNKMEKAIEWGTTHNKKVYSLGNLIHNERVVSSFNDRGVNVIDVLDIDRVEPGVIVLRAHGVKEEILRQLLKNGFLVVDATCPIVLREQDLIRIADEKYHIIVIGKANHPEAIFLYNVESSHSKTLVTSVEDVKSLSVTKDLFVVIQSTFPQAKGDAIIEELKRLETDKREVVIANSLCSSTRIRREAVEELSKTCDCIIVIGGHHSSNTLGLKVYAQSLKKEVFLINSKDEIPFEVYKYSKIGIATGASTPSFIIDEIVETLKRRVHEI